MTTNNNAIPRALDKIISLGVTALAGAESIGATVPLKLITAEDLAARVHDLLGDPATPLIPGKQTRYATQKAAVSAAYAAARLAHHAGRAYCMAALGVLRPVLGIRWNSQWNAVGFIQPSLVIPRQDPVPMLLRFRDYFNGNAAREVPNLNVTAAIAQARINAIQAANLAVAQARDQLVVRLAERNGSLNALRDCLSSLRAELEQVIPDDDGRWYDFGFRRPVDGQMPAPVDGLVLTILGPGAISAAWDHSTRAENYRVNWRIDGGSSPITDLGLFADHQCAITGLPSGSSIVVGVIARNDAGETSATEGSIIAP